MKTQLSGAIAALVLLTGCNTGPTLPDDQDARGGRDDAATVAGSGPFERCYQSVDFDVAAPVADRELFILIDQTTALDPQLASALSDLVANYLARGGGVRVNVGSFSATTARNFAMFKFSGEADKPLPRQMRDSVNARKLALLDQCLADAPRKLAGRVGAEMQALVSSDSGNYSNSEIIGSLAAVSEAVRQSSVSDKTVLIVSDLIEHSSTTSFYQNHDIREIDLVTEMQKVADRNQFGDFGGAKIYVMGAGLLPPEADENATRNVARLLRLREFWQNWIANSNGDLKAYGQPVLQVPLQ